MRGLALILVSLCWVGCVDDKIPRAGDGGVTDTGTRRDTSIPGVDGGECSGCRSPSGNCLSGDNVANCGGGGAMCATCGTGEECAEGECRMPPACDSSNCTGCCDGDDCIETPNDANCGAGGNECTTCMAPATCQAGACANPCDMMSCGGCCGVSGCVELEDQDETECGAMGAACGGCSGSEMCVDGACVDTGCMATCAGCCDGSSCIDPVTDAMCGSGGGACSDCTTAGNTCQSGLCAPDLTTTWNVVAVSGEVPERDLDGDPWDSFGGLPDAVVRLTIGAPGSEQTGETDDQPNTTTPAWNETILMGVTAQSIIDGATLTVFDDDGLLGYTEIGRCTLAYDAGDFPSVKTWTCAPNPMSPAMAGWVVTIRIEAP